MPIRRRRERRDYLQTFHEAINVYILGITIVGGEDSKRLGTGIFIKSILGGGIAAKDGTLQQGITFIIFLGYIIKSDNDSEARDNCLMQTKLLYIIITSIRPHVAVKPLFSDRTFTSHQNGPDPECSIQGT